MKLCKRFVFFWILGSFCYGLAMGQSPILFHPFEKFVAAESNQPPAFLMVRYNKQLKQKAVRLLNDSLAIFRSADFELGIKNPDLQWNFVNNNWKLSPILALRKGEISNQYLRFVIKVNSREKLEAIVSDLANKGIQIIQIVPVSNALVFSCSFQFFEKEILPLPDVEFADLYQPANAEGGVPGYNSSFHGINLLQHHFPNLTGQNQVVGLKENLPDATDIDIQKRVLNSPIQSTITSNHATAMAVLIGGAGNSYYDALGIAPACRFFPSNFNNLFADPTSVLSNNQVYVQNHSYGTIPQSYYGAEAESYDLQTWQNPSIQHVFSSGNLGTQAATEGPYTSLVGFANITGNFKQAKNIITVAGLKNSGEIAAESSAGPLFDGRMAPQITAIGPNGTSDAAALVSGTCLVLQQIYQQTNEQPAPSYLLRSALYSTATDIHLPGIDYKTGYGELNAFKAAKLLLENRFILDNVEPGKKWETNILIPTNVSKSIFTLAYNDLPANVNSFKALQNDLDIFLIEATAGDTIRPWVLETVPVAEALSKQATRGIDRLNNSEQITIDNPRPGLYKLVVQALETNSRPIPFAISYQFDTLYHFSFYNPVTIDNINREENPVLPIRWECHAPQLQERGSLRVSYDHGQSWQGISQPILGQRTYSWMIKDTVAPVQFSMETSFGTFFSEEGYLSAVTRLKVDYVCDDSIRISWPSNSFATNYTIFTKIDSPYLRPLATTSDPFWVQTRTNADSRVFAVQPRYQNKILAPRSLATHIDLQATKCFFQSLTYILFPKNSVELSLLLSTHQFVDSVVFYKVNENGEILQQLSASKMLPGSLLVKALSKITEPGRLLYTAQIVLNNGKRLNTEIVEIITSGAKWVYCYPNPVSNNENLQIIIQEGLPSASRLQLYDLNGKRIYEYYAIPGRILVYSLPKGVLVYRLTAADGSTLETGKIIVH